MFELEPFTEEDLIKIWKGLHYAMWMCDKAIIQVFIFLVIFWLFYKI